MSKKNRYGSRNRQEGEEALEILVAWDYQVSQLSQYHFRINGRLDIWPSTRAWYYLPTHEKGRYEHGKLEQFVRGFLKT